jgi:hypothetical protein
MENKLQVLLHDFIALAMIIMCILVFFAMKHYYSMYNAIVALGVVPVGYAIVVGLLGAVVIDMEDSSSDMLDSFVMSFILGMILPVCVYVVKILYLPVLWLGLVS